MEKVLSLDDSLFGVLSEEQVGINTVTEGRKYLKRARGDEKILYDGKRG